MNIMHKDLCIANETAYKPIELTINSLFEEIESKEYGACTFKLNDKIIKFRISKITPTKIGQFVTLWKRIGNGPIMPYDINDNIDLYIISVRDKENLGQFIFPKNILLEKDIISNSGIGGKWAMRIYPPWDIADNNQAKNTQKWQLLYFAYINDIKKIKELINK